MENGPRGTPENEGAVGRNEHEVIGDDDPSPGGPLEVDLPSHDADELVHPITQGRFFPRAQGVFLRARKSRGERNQLPLGGHGGLERPGRAFEAEEGIDRFQKSFAFLRECAIVPDQVKINKTA
ncbi:MAG: hypothetical protein ABWY78_12490, partial [Microvirga sp.]